MSRTRHLGVVAAALFMVAAAASPSRAVYMDEDQNWSLRMRAYSQFAIRLQQSDSKIPEGPSAVTGKREEIQTTPGVEAGQMIQNRWFANPELDANLTPYLGWMKKGMLSWLAPDDLRMRVAGWGFYDGIYDYGPNQFNRAQKQINENFNNFVPASTRDDRIREGGWYLQGSKIRVDRLRNLKGSVRASSIEEIFPGYELKDPREHYATHRRINEAYLSYSKGPVFIRAGKQSLSWGESDTVALLDQTNPFSVLLSAPGFFQDIDEARIPLWTLRASLDLFSTFGPFSSGFVEAYWVPGEIDTNTGFLPISTASPYSAPGSDAGRGNPIFPSTSQFILFDQVPEENMGNSRYGFRVQTVFNRFLTLQAWFYRTFPQQPVPMKIGFAPNDALPNRDINVVDSNGDATQLFIVSTQRRLTSVYGIAGTFYSEWVDGIVRLNAQLFENEPGFIPSENLGIGSSSESVLGRGKLPRADILRYEVGYDRFFFFRPLNPSNSFILSTSIVGSFNFDETDRQDFRGGGLIKPSLRNGNQRGNEIGDYVQQNDAEAQMQVTLQSDWNHGTIQPRVTAIAWTRGTYAIHPSVTYRWNDWLLFGADMQWITGKYQSLGFFRDRGQISFRVTYQLN